MPETLSLSQKLMSIEDNLSLSDELIFYIKSYVATLNGCSFCIDIAKAQAEKNLDINKYEHLLNYQSDYSFSDAEKAALQYTEQATHEKQVEDSVFEELQTYFNEKRLWK